MPSFLHIVEGYNREVTTRGFVDRLMGRLHADDTWMEIDPVYSQIWADAHQAGVAGIDGRGGRAALFKDVVFSHPELPKYLLETCLHWIESLDPTPDRRLCRWLIQKYATAGIKRFEDIPRATESLLQHDRLKKSGFFRRNTTHQEFRKFADSFSFRTLGDLDTFLASLDAKDFMSRSAKRDKEEQRLIDNGEVEILLDTEEVEIVIPKSKEASCHFGKNTKWCTAGSVYNMFDSYNKRGHLYIILLKAKNKRYQFHYEDAQYMDEMDEHIRPEELDALPPEIWKVLDKSYVYVTCNMNNISKFDEISWRTAKWMINRWVNGRHTSEREKHALDYFRDHFGGMKIGPLNTVFDIFLDTALETKGGYLVLEAIEFPQFAAKIEDNSLKLCRWAVDQGMSNMIPHLADKFNLWDNFKLMSMMLSIELPMMRRSGFNSWDDLSEANWDIVLTRYPWMYRMCPLDSAELASTTLARLSTTHKESWKVGLSRMSPEDVVAMFEDDNIDGARLNAVLEYSPHMFSHDTFYALLAKTEFIKYESMPEKYKNDPKYQIVMLNVMNDVGKRWDETIFLDRGIYPSDTVAVVAVVLFGAPAWGSVLATGYKDRKPHEGIDSERLIRIFIAAMKRKGKDNYGVLKKSPGYASQIPDDDWPAVIDAEPIIIKGVDFVPRTGQEHILKRYPSYFQYLPNLDPDIARSILATTKSATLKQQVSKFLEDK